MIVTLFFVGDYVRTNELFVMLEVMREVFFGYTGVLVLVELRDVVRLFCVMLFVVLIVYIVYFVVIFIVGVLTVVVVVLLVVVSIILF